VAHDSKRPKAETSPKAKNLGGRPKKARTDQGLKDAIEAAGSLGVLAAIAGVTTGAVSIWERVPQKAVDAISARLQISKHRLRPDLYDEANQPITKQ